MYWFSMVYRARFLGLRGPGSREVVLRFERGKALPFKGLVKFLLVAALALPGAVQWAWSASQPATIAQQDSAPTAQNAAASGPEQNTNPQTVPQNPPPPPEANPTPPGQKPEPSVQYPPPSAQLPEPAIKNPEGQPAPKPA